MVQQMIFFIHTATNSILLGSIRYQNQLDRTKVVMTKALFVLITCVKDKKDKRLLFTSSSMPEA